MSTQQKANEIQHGGTHYKDKPTQPWDYILANQIGFLEGNAIKYLTRWRDKGGIEDLKKARHYIDKLIESETAVDKQQPRTTGEELLSRLKNANDALVDPESRISKEVRRIKAGRCRIKPLGEAFASMERQVMVRNAVEKYLVVSERHRIATQQFHKASQTLRKRVGPNQRFIVVVNNLHHLVATDDFGAFCIESLPALTGSLKP